MISARNDAEIKSHKTGNVYKVSLADLDFQQDGGDERGMGPELLHSGSVEIGESGGPTLRCEWTVSEYPIGAFNHATKMAEHCTVIQDFEFYYDHPADAE